MTTENLTWAQIKELAEMAQNSGSDFVLNISNTGMEVKIKPNTPRITTTTSPSFPVTFCGNDKSFGTINEVNC